MSSDPLASLRTSDDEGALAANTLFYEALETADVELMEAVWSHGDEVSCAHPGRAPLLGWEAVSASWRAILQSGGNPQVITTELTMTRRGSVAWISLSENLFSGQHTGAASALNLFTHDGDRWHLVFHHAAPVLGSE